MINNSKYESHYPHHIAVLPRPEPSLTIEVPFKIELLVSLVQMTIFVVISDPFIQKPFQNLWAINLSYDDVIVCQIIKSRQFARFNEGLVFVPGFAFVKHLVEADAT